MTDVQYLVTTRAEDIPHDRVIFMIDGTVPGWSPKKGDYHFDHHRVGGALVQIDEMPPLPQTQPLLEQLANEEQVCIVTTLMDADACAAAAWLQLSLDHLGARAPDVIRRLRAIAFDCDHLSVPFELDDLSEFAANAVAALKLARSAVASSAASTDPSLAFRNVTQRLLNCALEQEPWPGERGEARKYWISVNELQRRLLLESRISTLNGAFVADLRQLDIYVDPRAVNGAALDYSRSLDGACDVGGLSMPRIILSVRDPDARWSDQSGLRYVLGTGRVANEQSLLDYCDAGVWRALTRAEAVRLARSSAAVDKHWGSPDFRAQLGFDPWGGRSTVGGSGWNSASRLLPHEVLEIVRRCT